MPHNKSSAFTLIEIMVSIAILSLGLVLILQNFSHSLTILKTSENYLKTPLLLENKMTDIEIALKEGKDVLSDLDELEEGNVLFKLNTILDAVECKKETSSEQELIYEGLYSINATLSWDERKRKNRIPVATYLIKYEKEEE